VCAGPDVTSLRSYADNAIAPTSRCRTWYDVGAALGDYRLARVDNREPPPSTDLFWDCVHSLSANEIERIEVLGSLVRLNDRVLPLEGLLETALDQLDRGQEREECPSDLRPPVPDIERVPSGEPFRDFIHAIIRGMEHPRRGGTSVVAATQHGSTGTGGQTGTAISAPSLGAPGRTTRREQEIIDIIREAGRRLTGEQVLTELDRKRGSASPGTTKNYLASLVRQKRLTNRRDVDPPGYGLPEWDIPGYKPG
jgi:hypothetical protein